MNTSNLYKINNGEFLEVLFGKSPIADHLKASDKEVMEVGLFELTRKNIRDIVSKNDAALDYLIEKYNIGLSVRRAKLARFQRRIPIKVSKAFTSEILAHQKKLNPILKISEKRTQYLSLIPASDEKKESLTQFEASIKLYKAELLSKMLPTFFFGSQFRCQFPFSARKRHAYILGASGSGKTELIKLFVYSDIKQRIGNLVLDPHGDLVEDLSKLKTKHKNIIYLSAEFGKIGHYFKLNPFDHEYHNKPDHIKQAFVSVKCQELLNAFAIVMETEFTGNMSRMVFNILQVLLYNKGMNLNDFLKCLRPATSESYERLAHQHPLENVRLYFEHDFNLKTLSITKQSVLTRFENALSNYHLAQIFDCDKSSFNLKKSLNQGKSILINASQGLLGEKGCRMLGSFLLSELTTLALQKADIPEQFRKPWMIYVDELQNFLTPRISKILSEARKYGLHLTMANQYLNQIENVNLRSAVLANTNIKCLGLSSNKDFETMSKELGLKNKTIPKLGKGRFVVKVGSYDALAIQAYDFLIGNKNNSYIASKDHFNRLNYNLAHYYQKTLSKEEKKKTVKRVAEPPKIEKLL